MNHFKTLISLFLATIVVPGVTSSSSAQEASPNRVVITGVRFAYPLVEKWIKDYTAENPKSQIVIESRTSTDPETYDLLIEAYDQERLEKEGRAFVSIGRYTLIPVANSKSPFAKEYADKGLTEKTYKQLFFYDAFAAKDKSATPPYTIYTRLQKAGAPVTFAKYFGYEQQQIKGKSIAGADEHLIKALLKDDTGVTYTVPGLAFDLSTRIAVQGLTVIPVDLDGNGKVSKEEKLADDLDQVIARLESGKTKNIPTEHIHLSIAKNSLSAEAKKFLLWVASRGEADLHHFGYLKADPKRLQVEIEKLEKFLAIK